MSDLFAKIAEVLSSSLSATDVARVIKEVRDELDRITVERNGIEAEALDPTTVAETVQQRRIECGDLDFGIKRLTLALERLEQEHEAAQVRDEQAARKSAYDLAAQAMATAGKALETRGETLAAELRQLIQGGDEALIAMQAANAALPRGATPLQPHSHCALLLPVPERIISQKMMDVWLDEETRQAVPESRLRVWPGQSLEELRRTRIAPVADVIGSRRAFLISVLEVTFIPAYRHDWLSTAGIPAQQIRHEKIPFNLAKAREALTAA